MFSKSSFSFASFAALALLVSGGCQMFGGGFAGPEEIEKAVAVLHSASGSDVHGTVKFFETKEGVRVSARIAGLQPNSKHGFHIHQYGNCTAKDASSAGGHYDPEDTDFHAQLYATVPHHAGDMGNIKAGGEGIATVDKLIPGISIAGGENPILGRAVIVHAQPDDFGQPSGHAGARIACGVIGVAGGE